MRSDPETPPGALAPRPGGAGLAEYDDATLTGGAGLFDYAARDPISPSAGRLAGLAAVVLTVVVGVLTVAGLWQRVAASFGALLSAALL